MLTDERLAEIRAREQAATPGPWDLFEHTIDRGAHKGRRVVASIGRNPPQRKSVIHPNWTEFEGGLWDAWLHVSPTDAAFIAASRQDIGDLLAEIERLRAEVALLIGDGREAPGLSDPLAGCTERTHR